MKNLIKSTIILSCFSLSLILFQISCQDEVEAQNNTTQTSNRFLYSYSIFDDNTSTSTVEYWTAKNDGSDNKKIPITLPAGLELHGGGRLTPDGQALIFTAEEADEVVHIYSISIDGTGLKKLVDGTGKTGPDMNFIERYFSVEQTY